MCVCVCVCVSECFTIAHKQKTVREAPVVAKLPGTKISRKCGEPLVCAVVGLGRPFVHRIFVRCGVVGNRCLRAWIRSVWTGFCCMGRAPCLELESQPKLLSVHQAWVRPERGNSSQTVCACC